MGVVDRRSELFENIARLRRAGRLLPGDEDISAVRAALERELGETVSRRLAARLLRVSHTALDRWIKSGDLPVVYAKSGRMEIPVPVLLELREAIDEAGAGRYALAPVMRRRREAAARLDVQPGPALEGHDRARARSLAYHRALATRLRKPMVDEARHVLYRWRDDQRIDPAYADRWEEVLRRPIPEIRRAIVDESPDADDLRQNSPLAGLLSEPERRKILEQVR